MMAPAHGVGDSRSCARRKTRRIICGGLLLVGIELDADGAEQSAVVVAIVAVIAIVVVPMAVVVMITIFVGEDEQIHQVADGRTVHRNIAMIVAEIGRAHV